MKIAITGNIGSGKSTVCSMIADEGYPVISADAVNGVLQKDPRIQTEIIRMLGLEKYSKEAVAFAIFRSNALRKELEAYLHPLIYRKIAEFLAEKPGLAFAEVPLLFETGGEKFFDCSVSVITDPKIADGRLKTSRSLSPEAIRARRLKQLGNEDKTRRADYVIHNDGDLANLRRQVNLLLGELERLKDGKYN